MARRCLITALEDNQLRHIKGRVHARDIYEALKAHHEKATRSARVSLLKKLCALNLPDGGEIEAHLFEFEQLFDRLEAAGTSLDTDTMICMLLRSLPASYDGVVTALDCLVDDDISLEIVKAKLEDEYNRQMERQGGASKRCVLPKASIGKSRRCVSSVVKPDTSRRTARSLRTTSRRNRPAPGMRRPRLLRAMHGVSLSPPEWKDPEAG